MPCIIVIFTNHYFMQFTINMYINIGVLVTCIVILTIHYFMQFTINLSSKNRCRVSETLGVVSVDLSSAVRAGGCVVVNGSVSARCA